MGEVATLWDEKAQRWIFALITKENYYEKPTLERSAIGPRVARCLALLWLVAGSPDPSAACGSMRQALKSLSAFCTQNTVTAVSMPEIGCGLDMLKVPPLALPRPSLTLCMLGAQWADVSEIIKQELTSVSVTVYRLPGGGRATD